MGRGLTSGGQESGSVFSAAVCKIQVSERYIESLTLVPKDKKLHASPKVKGPLYSCLLIAHLPSRSRTLNWYLETIYSGNISLCKENLCQSSSKISPELHCPCLCLEDLATLASFPGHSQIWSRSHGEKFSAQLQDKIWKWPGNEARATSSVLCFTERSDICWCLSCTQNPT